MIHKLSYDLTNWFYQRKWIERQNYEWCLYVVEKKIASNLFLFYRICLLFYIRAVFEHLDFYIHVLFFTA